MFAVLKTGGKQYRVSENQIVIVEKILGDEGSTYTFEDVLMLEDGSQVTVGQPIVSGAKVVASIVEQGKGDKVIIFKKTRRHTYRRKNGHRQLHTVLRIEQIAKPGDDIKPVTPRITRRYAKVNEALATSKPQISQSENREVSAEISEKTVKASKPAVKKSAPREGAQKNDVKVKKPASKDTK
jgi:large subunit ribosomal protein L21